MFKAEDFELPLEAHLKLRVVSDEVNNCDDVEQLREQLIASARLLMSYQHIINRVLREQIMKDLGIGLLEGDAS